MSQYNTGTVAVTNGNAAIVGTGTAWLTGISAGDVFTINGSNVPYTIGSVTDDTHATLSSNYAGATASAQPYSITTSFTPDYSIPYPESGDVDTSTILKRALILIDTLFTAAKTYTDGLVVGLLDDRGNYDASGNTFPASGGSGTAGAILKGDLWYITVAGTLGTLPVIPGDTVRALVDTPGQTAGNWSVMASASEDIAANIHAATGKTTPVNADELGIVDSAASNVLKKLTFANLWAWIQGKLNFAPGYTTTVTSATPLTLTVSSTYHQDLTGSTAQTVVLPVASTLNVGHAFFFDNDSTADATVNSSGGNLVKTIPAGNFAWIVCVLNSGTGAASWSARMSLNKENTFVAELRDGPTGNLATSLSAAGWYRRSGNHVHCTISFINIDTTGLTAGNQVHITNLPFTSITSSNSRNETGIIDYSACTVSNYLHGYIPSNASYALIKDGAANFLVSGISSGTGDLFLSFSYAIP